MLPEMLDNLWDRLQPVFVPVPQLARGALRINEATGEKFGNIIADRVPGDRPVLSRACVSLPIEKIAVTSDDISIVGSEAALEAAIVHGDRRGLPAVPNLDRE